MFVKIVGILSQQLLVNLISDTQENNLTNKVRRIKVVNVPCYVCIGFSELYRQDRVQLHIQFFLSLLLVSVVSILWYLLVHYELLSNPVATASVIYRNPVTVLS